jgi:hypothetical protein
MEDASCKRLSFFFLILLLFSLSLFSRDCQVRKGGGGDFRRNKHKVKEQVNELKGRSVSLEVSLQGLSFKTDSTAHVTGIT